MKLKKFWAVRGVRGGGATPWICHWLAYHYRVDPGFPEEGASTNQGRQHTNLPDFPKNCMKLRKFWSGGARWSRPLGSDTASYVTSTRSTLIELVSQFSWFRIDNSI